MVMAVPVGNDLWRKVWLLTAMMLAMSTIGCSQAVVDAQARYLISPVDIAERLRQDLMGPADEWIDRGRLDLHRRIAAADGIEIDTWVIQGRSLEASPDSESHTVRGTVVLLHPLLSNKMWFVDLATELAQRHWDTVLLDLRAHGRSGGEYFTWGAKEKHDVKAVVDDLLADGSIREPIYVCGASAGGCVAVQYAAIDPRCQGVMAVAPPAGLPQIGRRMLLMLGDDDFEAALMRAGEMGQFDPADADAVAAAAQLTCPVRIAHGWWDFAVPIEHSQAILDASGGPKALVHQIAFGHALELGRPGWMADQIEAMAAMAQPVVSAWE